MDLYGRNFLTLKDFSKEEIRYFLDLFGNTNYHSLFF